MNDNDDSFSPYINDGCIVLPHQCHEWFIGGRKDVQVMIQQLTDLLNDPELKP